MARSNGQQDGKYSVMKSGVGVTFGELRLREEHNCRTHSAARLEKTTLADDDAHVIFLKDPQTAELLVSASNNKPPSSIVPIYIKAPWIRMKPFELLNPQCKHSLRIRTHTHTQGVTMCALDTFNLRTANEGELFMMSI